MADAAIKRPARPAVTLFAETDLPTERGSLRVRVYQYGPRNEEALAITLGAFPASGPVFARVHSECFTGEVLGSLKCDCRDQLEQALAELHARGHGVIVYLRQEGRGIGLGNKIRAYALQAAGADTIEANHRLGFPTDLRTFDVAAEVLRQLGVSAVHLHTNNPDKQRALAAGGIEVVSRVAAHGAVNAHNRGYLETKHQRLGHDLAAALAGAPKRRS